MFHDYSIFKIVSIIISNLKHKVEQKNVAYMDGILENKNEEKKWENWRK